MFAVTSQKDTITVKRKLTLKKDGVLPGGVLDCVANIDLGKNLSTSEGKSIVSKFDSLFNGKISGKAKKQDERIEKARQQLARWMHQGESETKIKTYADTQQEGIIRDWNQFMRVDLKRAAYDALKDALKNSSINYDDLKLKFSNTDLQDNKMEFMTGVLNIPGRGGQGRKAKAGMATLVSGMQNLAKPVGAIREGLERNVKLTTQGAQDAAAVQKNLVAVRKAMAGMNARLTRMKKLSETTNKIAVQSSKGVDVVMQETAKHHKVAKLNDHDKIVTFMSKALAEFNGAKQRGKDTVMRANTSRLETVLKNINKLLLEAEQLSKAEAEAFGKARRANNVAKNNMEAGESAVIAALKELRLQFKMS